MNLASLHLSIVSPEIIVLIMACVALMVDLFVPQKNHVVTYALILLTLIAATVSTIFLYNSPVVYALNGMFIHDKVASLIKLAVYITSFFAFVYSRDYIAKRNMHQGEYYILGLFSVFGMMVLVSANSLLVLFLGLELMSLPIYAMIAMNRKSTNCSEAAVKYFVIGGMASAILLYGLSMIYGATNSLDINHIATIIATTPAHDQLILLFGLVFVITGIFFKLGAAPFHMWAPDVYQGAPTSVTLFLGTAAKIATFGLVLRLLIDAMPTLDMQWQQILIVISIASMAIGNVVAIVQKNLKRMLAYSSVAQMGYVTLGLAAATPQGYSAALFYMLIYALMSAAAFGMIILLSRSGFEAENIKDFRGLNSRNPWLAFLMLLVMFSMAGVPPMIGFFAKFSVLVALINAHLLWLAVVAIIFAVIGSYYYLSVVKVMYFEEPTETTPIVLATDHRIAIAINGFAILALGIFPIALIHLCRQALGG